MHRMGWLFDRLDSLLKYLPVHRGSHKKKRKTRESVIMIIPNRGDWALSAIIGLLKLSQTQCKNPKKIISQKL